MRIIARMPAEDQVGFLVDTLKNIGYDRKDMIISNIAKEQQWATPLQAAENVTLIKSERDSLNDVSPFAEGIKGLRGKEGILVAVETSKREAAKVRNIMEQSGAAEIIQD